jgi:hypothetical protein
VEGRVATAGTRSLPPSQQGLIREFIQALAEKIEATERRSGASVTTVSDG